MRNWADYIGNQITYESFREYGGEGVRRGHREIMMLMGLRELCDSDPASVGISDVIRLFKHDPIGSVHEKVCALSRAPKYDSIQRRCKKIDGHIGGIADIVRYIVVLNKTYPSVIPSLRDRKFRRENAGV
jgi:hypothetical protein